MNLVYLVVGGHPGYYKLLDYCVNTIRNMNKVDILVMCEDPSLVDQPVTKYETGPNEGPMQVSIRKTQIFDVPGLEKYEKILYLDADIVVHGSLDPLFEAIEDPDTLYVMYESGNEHIFRTDKPVPKGVKGFNCGQFGFMNSPQMRAHFQTVAQTIRDEFDPKVHFYEQVFMNDYFWNKKTSLLPGIAFNNDPPKIVQHFMNAAWPWQLKLRMMQAFHAKVEKYVQMIETRNDLYKVLKLESPVIAEIGVFRGEFAKVLMDTFKSSRLILIDPWVPGKVCSGDQDGNNLIYIDAEEAYCEVLKLPGPEIQRVFSKDAQIEPKSLDMLYIDGDHSYEGCKTDLELGLKWVKHGGWICGHDFCMNPAKTSQRYDFGVERAVGEFCVKYGLNIHWLAMDGCVSYAIQR